MARSFGPAPEQGHDPLRRRFITRAPGALLAVLAAPWLSGCGGYKFGSGPSILPERFKTLAIKRVDNPTVEYWLEDELRAEIRDEFSRRRLVNWADVDEADAWLYLTIVQYSRPGSIRNNLDRSVKYSVNLSFEAEIRARENNEPIWKSREISIREPFYEGGQEDARLQAATMAARRLADLMVHAY